MFRIIIFCALLAASAKAAGNTGSPAVPDSIDWSSLIYGEGYSYHLKAPSGWLRDDTWATRTHNDACFFPEGYTDKPSPVIVFSLHWYLEEGTPMTALDATKMYGAQFVSDSPGARIDSCPPLLTQGGQLAQVRLYADDAGKVYQMVAFNEAPKLIIAIFLSSNHKMEFDNAVAKFREIAASFVFLTDKVKIRPKPDSSKTGK